jgi:hypothetical protein
LKRLSSQYERFNGLEKAEWQKSKAFLLPIALNTGLLDDLGDDDHAKFELIFELTSKVESNCFGICAFTKQLVVGRALFPVASFFRHSCIPNCVLEQVNFSYSYPCRKGDLCRLQRWVKSQKEMN